MTELQKIKNKKKADAKRYDRALDKAWKRKYPNGQFHVNVTRDDVHEACCTPRKVILIGVNFCRVAWRGQKEIYVEVCYSRTDNSKKYFVTARGTMLPHVGRNYYYDDLEKAIKRAQKSGAEEDLIQLFDEWFTIWNSFENKADFWLKFTGRKYCDSFQIKV